MTAFTFDQKNQEISELEARIQDLKSRSYYGRPEDTAVTYAEDQYELHVLEHNLETLKNQ